MTIEYDESYADNDQDDSLGIIQDQEGGTIAFNSAELMSANFDGGIPTSLVTLAAADVQIGDYIFWNFTTNQSLPGFDATNDSIEDTDNPADYIDTYLVTGVEDNEEDGGTVLYKFLLMVEDEEVATGETPHITSNITTNPIYAIREDWANKQLGETGWLITSAGNAIFTNVAARGTIEAVDGYLNNLDVNGTLDVYGTIRVTGTANSDLPDTGGDEDKTTTTTETWGSIKFLKDPSISAKLQAGIVMNKNGFIIRAPKSKTNSSIVPKFKVPLNGSALYIDANLNVNDPDDPEDPTNDDKERKLRVGTKKNNITIKAFPDNKAIFTTLAGKRTVWSVDDSAEQTLDGFLLQTLRPGGNATINSNNTNDYKTRMRLAGSTGYLTFDSSAVSPNPMLKVSGTINAREGFIGGEDSGWRITSNLISSTNTTTISKSTTGTNGTSLLTVLSGGTEDLAVSMFVSGTGIPSGTYITLISGNLITLSNNLTNNNSGTSIFTPNKIYFYNSTNPTLTISNQTSAPYGAFGSITTPFYVDGKGNFSLGDKLIFENSNSEGFGTLTVIGKIRGAVENWSIVEEDVAIISSVTVSNSSDGKQQATFSTANLSDLSSKNHIYSIDDAVVISGLTGVNATLNGAWRIYSKTNNTFTIREEKDENGNIVADFGSAATSSSLSFNISNASGTSGQNIITFPSTTNLSNVSAGHYVYGANFVSIVGIQSFSEVLAVYDDPNNIESGYIITNNSLSTNLSSATLTFRPSSRVKELTIGLHRARPGGSPAGYGIRIDDHNYWFVNNQFKVGNSQTHLKWDGTTFKVVGSIFATGNITGSIITGSSFRTADAANSTATEIPLSGQIKFASIEGGITSPGSVRIDPWDAQINSASTSQGLFKLTGSSKWLIMDPNDIQTINSTGGAAELRIQRLGGNLTLGSSSSTINIPGTLTAGTFNPSSLTVTNNISTTSGDITAGGRMVATNRLRVASVSDVSTGTGNWSFLIGSEDNLHTRMDNNEIQVMSNNSSYNDFYIQPLGGFTNINNGLFVAERNTISISNSNNSSYKLSISATGSSYTGNVLYLASNTTWSSNSNFDAIRYEKQGQSNTLIFRVRGDGSTDFYAQGTSFSNSVVGSETVRSGSADFNHFRGASGSDGQVFKVDGIGEIYADGGAVTSPADYAEYFEWQDGNLNNEDRVGYSVVLNNGKILKAQQGDIPFGVVSVNPSISGDAAWNAWQGKYLKDEFGRYILEDYNVFTWTDEESGYNEIEEDLIDENFILPENYETLILQRRKLNPEYDSSVEYIPRSDRKEWSEIGLLGKLRLRKGQPVAPSWIKLRDISENVEEWLVR